MVGESNRGREGRPIRSGVPELSAGAYLRGNQAQRAGLRFDHALREWPVQVSWWRIYRAAHPRGPRKGSGKPETGPVETRGLIDLNKYRLFRPMMIGALRARANCADCALKDPLIKMSRAQ